MTSVSSSEPSTAHSQPRHRWQEIKREVITKAGEKEHRGGSCHKKPPSPPAVGSPGSVLLQHTEVYKQLHQNQLLDSLVALRCWLHAAAPAEFKRQIGSCIILIKLPFTLWMKSCYITGLLGFLMFYFNSLKVCSSPYSSWKLQI